VILAQKTLPRIEEFPGRHWCQENYPGRESFLEYRSWESRAPGAKDHEESPERELAPGKKSWENWLLGPSSQEPFSPRWGFLGAPPLGAPRDMDVGGTSSQK